MFLSLGYFSLQEIKKTYILRTFGNIHHNTRVTEHYVNKHCVVLAVYYGKYECLNIFQLS